MYEDKKTAESILVQQFSKCTADFLTLNYLLVVSSLKLFWLHFIGTQCITTCHIHTVPHQYRSIITHHLALHTFSGSILKAPGGTKSKEIITNIHFLPRGKTHTPGNVSLIIYIMNIVFKEKSHKHDFIRSTSFIRTN